MRNHRRTSLSCSDDLDAGDLHVSRHVHVFEDVVTEAVWEAHHGAFWELDVEGVIVEGDGQLLEERHGQIAYKRLRSSVLSTVTSCIIH